MSTPEDKVKIDKDLKDAILANNAKQEQLREDLLKQQKQESADLKSSLQKIKREERDIEAKEAWKDVTKWVGENADVVKGQESYVEFSTSMMNLCQGLYYLNKALAYDNMFERGIRYVWNETIGETKAGQAIEFFAGQAKEKVEDLLDQGLKKIHLKKDKLPEIVYDVRFDDDGKLLSRLTINGAPPTPDQEKMFNSGLVAWLEHRGCTFDADTGILTDENDDIMTPEKYKELSRDDENGFTAFFEGRCNLEVSSAPRP